MSGDIKWTSHFKAAKILRMFLFYILSFFKKGDTIQGRTLFKGWIRIFKISRFCVLFFRFELKLSDFTFDFILNETNIFEAKMTIKCNGLSTVVWSRKKKNSFKWKQIHKDNSHWRCQVTTFFFFFSTKVQQ